MVSRSESSGTGLRVLLTGASGLIGRRLNEILQEQGYDVVRLSRNRNLNEKSNNFFWDPDAGYIDKAALEGVSAIIHLAGENIASGRWTKRRRRRIVASRVNTTKLLYDTVIRESFPVNRFISASATGIYGMEHMGKVMQEEDVPAEADDFLAVTTRLWEESAGLFRSSGIRTVKIRTAIVVSSKGGFLKKLIPLTRLGFVPLFGSGDNPFPWIEIDDLCAVYIKALEDDTLEGAYNAAFPEQVTQKEFMEVLAALRGSSVNTLTIPPILLRIVFGEMSDLLLKGNHISAEKLLATGFSFRHPGLMDTLNDLLSD
jgi:uncharacterized protein